MKLTNPTSLRVETERTPYAEVVLFPYRELYIGDTHRDDPQPSPLGFSFIDR